MPSPRRVQALMAVLALASGFAGSAVPARAQALETGIASWYGPDFHGKRTSNGEVYDKEKLTAAHRTLPFGSYLRVENLDNGSSVVVRVNDRGPFAKNRIIDLSEAAARIVGMIPTGTALVSLAVIPEEEALAWKGGSIDGSVAAASEGQAALEGQAARGSDIATRVRIQVASYASEANAKATVERLAFSGLEAEIERAGSRFRVVFPELSPDQSRLVSLRLDGLGYRGYLVTTIKPSVEGR